jgi:hypothetical protein
VIFFDFAQKRLLSMDRAGCRWKGIPPSEAEGSEVVFLSLSG